MQKFKQPSLAAMQGDHVGICVTQFDPALLERGFVWHPPPSTPCDRLHHARQLDQVLQAAGLVQAKVPLHHRPLNCCRQRSVLCAAARHCSCGFRRRAPVPVSLEPDPDRILTFSRAGWLRTRCSAPRRPRVAARPRVLPRCPWMKRQRSPRFGFLLTSSGPYSVPRTAFVSRPNWRFEPNPPSPSPRRPMRYTLTPCKVEHAPAAELRFMDASPVFSMILRSACSSKFTSKKRSKAWSSASRMRTQCWCGDCAPRQQTYRCLLI